MDKNTKNTLLRIFSMILKNRSKDAKYPLLTLSLVEYYTRKDLIEIIKSRCKDNPEEDVDFTDAQNLIFLTECEKIDLFKFVKDDLYLMAYTTKQWADEIRIVKAETKEEVIPTNLPVSNEAPTAQEEKKDIPPVDKKPNSEQKDRKGKKN